MKLSVNAVGNAITNAKVRGQVPALKKVMGPTLAPGFDAIIEQGAIFRFL